MRQVILHTTHFLKQCGTITLFFLETNKHAHTHTHTSERENDSKTKTHQLNKLEYDHLDNILVFLNTKKKPIKNKFDLKYGKKKNSKPNNKNINLFILNLKK